MSQSVSQQSRGALTSTVVQQTLTSDPRQAEALGAFFSSTSTAEVITRDLGTFEVDGKSDGVLYRDQGSRNVVSQMQMGPTLTGGSDLTISAGGEIDKNGIWGWGDVSPTDRTDGGSTRLQLAVVRDGRLVEELNYTPDADGSMRISIPPEYEGAQLGFYFADGGLNNNSGQFDVRVTESMVRAQQTDVQIAAADAEGVYEAGAAVTEALTAAPPAATLPAPDPALSAPAPADSLTVENGTNTVHTPDGYRFQFDNNEVAIYTPDREETPATLIQGREVIEADGTNWQAEDGLYVAPNGAMLSLEYNGDTIKDATVVNGDAVVQVDGEGWGDGPVRIGEVEGGGYEWRAERVEENAAGRTYRLGGYNDGVDDRDVTWNAEMLGENLGVVMDGHDPEDGNFAVDGQPYVVDPSLRPSFGSQDYERMLRSEIEDQRSTIAGAYQSEGAEPDWSRLMADYMLGQSGSFDAYANEMAQSAAMRDPVVQRQLAEQALMQRLMGGLPQQFQSYPQAMQALNMLMQLMAAQAAMQNRYQQGMQGSQSFMPSGAANLPPELLIQQALQGLGYQGGGYDPMHRFDLQQGAYGGGRRADPAAGLIAQRMQQGQPYEPGIERTIANLAHGMTGGAAAPWAARGAANAVRNAPGAVARGAGRLRNAAARMRSGVTRVRPGAGLRSGANVIDMVRNSNGVWEARRGTSAIVPRNTRALTRPTTALTRAGTSGTVSAARGGSRALSAARALGKPLLVVGLVADTIDIGSSYNRDVERGDGNYTETKRAVGRAAGGWTGAAAGAAAGAAVGSVVPIVGTAAGAVIGGIAGAFGGSAVGDWIGGLF